MSETKKEFEKTGISPGYVYRNGSIVSLDIDSNAFDMIHKLLEVGGRIVFNPRKKPKEKATNADGWFEIMSKEKVNEMKSRSAAKYGSSRYTKTTDEIEDVI